MLFFNFLKSIFNHFFFFWKPSLYQKRQAKNHQDNAYALLYLGDILHGKLAAQLLGQHYLANIDNEICCNYGSKENKYP